MKTFIVFDKYTKREIPENFHKYNNRSDEAVVAYFIDRYSKKEDKVIDVFAGLGTTLFLAEEMERIPYGVELIEEKCQFIRKNLKNKDNIIHGDSRKLSEYDIPKCDFSFSSPIFMNKTESINPLSGFTSEGGYNQYLKEIQKIYSNLKTVMKPNSTIVIEVSNLKNQDVLTTLAWDIAFEVSQVFHFEGEVIVVWNISGLNLKDGTFGYGYDHHYCLVFRNI